jgi:DNA-binding transcriptional regulator YbjK
VNAAATTSAPARSEQGAERRAAILDATVRLMVREGLAAVTHRAVAREAGVPLAATTYYFASKDELVVEALEILVKDEIARPQSRRSCSLMPRRRAACSRSSRSTSRRRAVRACGQRPLTGSTPSPICRSRR